MQQLGFEAAFVQLLWPLVAYYAAHNFTAFQYENKSQWRWSVLASHCTDSDVWNTVCIGEQKMTITAHYKYNLSTTVVGCVWQPQINEYDDDDDDDDNQRHTQTSILGCSSWMTKR